MGPIIIYQTLKINKTKINVGIIYKRFQNDTRKIKILKKHYVYCSVYFSLQQAYAHCIKSFNGGIVQYMHDSSIKLFFFCNFDAIPWSKMKSI